jgi:hypothetical protein
MTVAGAALQIQDHNTGFLHVLQKQQLNRDYLQTERIEMVEQRRLGLFVRWKLLPIPSALVPLGIRVPSWMCPSRFSRCVGHGQPQIMSRTVRAAWALERHFNHLAVAS